MALFHTVKLSCFDGKNTAFNKFNLGTGYKAHGTHPNKVTFSFHFVLQHLFFFHIGLLSCVFNTLLVFMLLFYAVLKQHDHAKDFWLHQLATHFSFYKLDLLDYFRDLLGLCVINFLFN